VFDWQERTWPGLASALTVASRELERRAVGLGAPVERVHYVPNGLTAARIAALAPDPTAVAEFRTRRLPGDGPSILLYTRFVEFDPAGIADLLAGVRARVPGTRLVIAGCSADGKAESALLTRARTLGCDNAIVQLGWIDPGQLGFIAGACDFAIHPFADSRLNRAKSPVKLLELMASGIPVVTTDVGEAPAFIEHGINGIIAPPGDTTALVAVVSSGLEQPDLRTRIGRAARERVARHFVWDRLVDRVLQAYEVGLGNG
jgi:glycosyltransferase involved in cell wall biosynthesis